MVPIGRIRATTTSNPINVSLIGVKNFPTISMIFEGLSDNKHANAKNNIVNKINETGPASFDKKGFTPISNDTFPDLGIAKKARLPNRESS